MSIKENYIGSDLRVHAPHQRGTIYPLDEICHGRTIVLKVFGRFGCPFMRLDAIRISEQKEKLEELGASLVGVGFDEKGESDFRMGGFWKGEVYLDHERCIYNFFQLPRVSKLHAAQTLTQKRIRGLYSTLKHKYGANLHGDILQTGGIFVINCKGRVLYACPQSDIAVFSNIPDIVKVCQNEHTRRTFKPVPAFTETLNQVKLIEFREPQITNLIPTDNIHSSLSYAFVFKGKDCPAGAKIVRLKNRS